MTSLNVPFFKSIKSIKIKEINQMTHRAQGRAVLALLEAKFNIAKEA
jgi:hypothetical protein